MRRMLISCFDSTIEMVEEYQKRLEEKGVGSIGLDLNYLIAIDYRKAILTNYEWKISYSITQIDKL